MHCHHYESADRERQARRLVMRSIAEQGPIDPELLVDVIELAALALRTYQEDAVYEVMRDVTCEADLRLLRPLARLGSH